MRVALVHDWLTGMRGGAKVLEVLCELYPSADLFTLVHRRGSVSPVIERRRIETSFVERLPLASRHYRRYLPLFPWAIERFRLDGYDLIISSSHCVAKAVIPRGTARHVCYCHSPMRYAWDQFDAYFGPDRVGAMASRWFYRPVLERLATWDAATASRVDRFVANSKHVAGRICRYYNRAAAVVYPFLDQPAWMRGLDREMVNIVDKGKVRGFTRRTAEDGIDQTRRRGFFCTFYEIYTFVNSRVVRDPVEVEQLMEGEAERNADLGVELLSISKMTDDAVKIDLPAECS